jgi:tRNA (pseudouridine54-N1)-methyltransferase
MLEPEGVPMRTAHINVPALFVLSDHHALSKNSAKGLERLGLQKLSLGPQMLFAYQAVSLVHYELDCSN